MWTGLYTKIKQIRYAAFVAKLQLITNRWLADYTGRVSATRWIVHAAIVVQTPVAIPFALHALMARVMPRTVEKGEVSRNEVLVCLGAAHAERHQHMIRLRWDDGTIINGWCLARQAVFKHGRIDWRRIAENAFVFCICWQFGQCTDYKFNAAHLVDGDFVRFHHFEVDTLLARSQRQPPLVRRVFVACISNGASFLQWTPAAEWITRFQTTRAVFINVAMLHTQLCDLRRKGMVEICCKICIIWFYTFCLDRTNRLSCFGAIIVSGRMALPGSISILSYSPGSWPDISTFLINPLAVPKNASVCGPVIAAVTDVIDSFSKSNNDDETSGDTPLIFRPTLQKLYTFPVD